MEIGKEQANKKEQELGDQQEMGDSDNYTRYQEDTSIERDYPAAMACNCCEHAGSY